MSDEKETKQEKTETTDSSKTVEKKVVKSDQDSEVSSKNRTRNDKRTR